MAMSWGGRTFGKKNPVTMNELKQMDWNKPDSDGKTRVFSKELWDDPTVGKLLREVGMTPDDAQNIRKTAEDYRADFARAKARLDQRVAQTNAEYGRRFGHCRVSPFLLIDGPIWDGPHGSFLFGQLGLCAYDDWNVMLLAADMQTVKTCPFLPHIGSEPALLKAATDKVATLHARYDHGLELFGLTATGQDGGISREMWDQMEKDIAADLMTFADNARRVLSHDLERFAADIKSGKVKI